MNQPFGWPYFLISNKFYLRVIAVVRFNSSQRMPLDMTNSKSEPKGCLGFLLGLFTGGSDSTEGESDELPYRIRDDFLSSAELSFYKVLQRAVLDQAVVLTKVNLADIFFVLQPKENISFRNKIDRKHVDFLICSIETMSPLAGIELDDSSHSRSDRQLRDELVNEVFAAAGLPLLRFSARVSYNQLELAKSLATILDAKLSVPSKTTVPLNSDPAAGKPPQCPKCKSNMVVRKATKGPNAGKTFWGCPNYPQCKTIFAIE
jgi:hypothetical protein